MAEQDEVQQATVLVEEVNGYRAQTRKLTDLGLLRYEEMIEAFQAQVGDASKLLSAEQALLDAVGERAVIRWWTVGEGLGQIYVFLQEKDFEYLSSSSLPVDSSISIEPLVFQEHAFAWTRDRSLVLGGVDYNLPSVPDGQQLLGAYLLRKVRALVVRQLDRELSLTRSSWGRDSFMPWSQELSPRSDELRRRVAWEAESFYRERLDQLVFWLEESFPKDLRDNCAIVGSRSSLMVSSMAKILTAAFLLSLTSRVMIAEDEDRLEHGRLVGLIVDGLRIGVCGGIPIIDREERLSVLIPCYKPVMMTGVGWPS